MTFAVNHLIGFGARRAAGATAITRTYITSAASASDLTTYTFAGIVATAGATRKCVAVITARGATATTTLSTCTIAGVSATCTTLYGAGNSQVSIAVADVPTGSTGDVVVTFSAGMARAAVALYDMFGASSSTPTATGNDATDAYTYSLTCTAGSVVFAGATDAETSSFTWTNLTENVDSTANYDSQTYSMASAEFATSQSGLTLTGDIAATISGGSGFAVFSP